MAERRFVETDLCVLGAGPAGLAAAVTAAESGARVTLVDHSARPGGQIWRSDLDGPPPDRAREWLRRAQDAGDRIEQLCGQAVFDASLEPLSLRASSTAPGGCVTQIQARALVLATGARERFLPFPGWTLPGVIGVGALQAFAKQGLAVAGRELVIAGTGPLLLAVAADMLERGAKLSAIVEQSSRRKLMTLGASALAKAGKRGQALAIAAKLASVPQLFSAWPIRAEGRDRVTAVVVERERSLGRSSQQTLRCELLACSFDLVPEIRVARLLGLRVAKDAIVTDALQRSSAPEVFAAGECCGVAGVDVALVEGEIAGLVASGREPASALLERRDEERRFADRLADCYGLRPELLTLAQPDTVVCRCEGVTLAQLRGHRDAREAKLQTRCGMGACQGRVCGPATQTLLGWAADRPRPPLFPVPVDHLGDHLGDPRAP